MKVLSETQDTTTWLQRVVLRRLNWSHLLQITSQKMFFATIFHVIELAISICTEGMYHTACVLSCISVFCLSNPAHHVGSQARASFLSLCFSARITAEMVEDLRMGDGLLASCPPKRRCRYPSALSPVPVHPWQRFLLRL